MEQYLCVQIKKAAEHLEDIIMQAVLLSKLDYPIHMQQATKVYNSLKETI